jgi:hypothetical protein
MVCGSVLGDVNKACSLLSVCFPHRQWLAAMYVSGTHAAALLDCRMSLFQSAKDVFVLRCFRVFIETRCAYTPLSCYIASWPHSRLERCYVFIWSTDQSPVSCNMHLVNAVLSCSFTATIRAPACISFQDTQSGSCCLLTQQHTCCQGRSDLSGKNFAHALWGSTELSAWDRLLGDAAHWSSLCLTGSHKCGIIAHGCKTTAQIEQIAQIAQIAHLNCTPLDASATCRTCNQCCK